MTNNNFFIVYSGGGNGLIGTGSKRFARSRDNFLFWGRKEVDAFTGEEYIVFEGGREVAFSAGVHNRYGRGRSNYIFDANGDGLLDIFVMQVGF